LLSDPDGNKTFGLPGKEEVDKEFPIPSVPGVLDEPI